MAIAGRPSMTSALAGFWHALAAWAKLFANRKHLRDDTRYRVEIYITGTVAGYTVREQLTGWLNVGSPSTQSSAHSVPTADVVAELWEHIPATRRQDLQDQLAAYWSDHQAMPDVDEAKTKAAKLWLQRLRSTIAKEREGPVSLELDGDPDDTKAAKERWAA